MMRRSLLLAVAATVATQGVALGQQAARTRALPFDSIAVQSFLAEALRAAMEAPPADRSALVVGVGRAQLHARDFAGAERTLSLGEQATPAEVARGLGESLVFVGLDRADLATSLVCALRNVGRSNEALSVVRRMPAGEDREWQLARAAGSAVRARQPQWREALELANEVALPQARLDALIAVAERAANSAGQRDVALSAFDAARAIRLSDGDLQSSREAVLATVAITVGRLEDARALYRGLSNAEDLHLVFMAAARDTGRASFVRELAPRTIEAARGIRDAAARYAFLSSVRAELVRVAGRPTADDLLPERLVGHSPSGLDETSYDSVVARSNDPGDVAERAVDRGDFAAARAAVARLPVVDRRARRAAVLSNLGWAAYGAYRDTAAVLFKLAHEALIASRADSAVWDGLGAEIADRQFWIANDEEGFETLKLVRDPSAARFAIDGWGSSTFSSITADRLRAYADRVGDSRIRDAVLLRMIMGYLTRREATREQLGYARAVADSIASPGLAIKGRLVVALALVQRGDTVGATTELKSLLADPSLSESDAKASVVARLASYGDLVDVTAWARVGDAAQRSRRLIALADALQSFIDATRNGYGPGGPGSAEQSCRDVF